MISFSRVNWWKSRFMSTASENILRDGLGREINYLRLSVTGGCNLRCLYCMPSARGARASQAIPALGLEDISKIVRVLSGLGIKKVRLTGGEPLARRDVLSFVRMLSSAGDIKISMTTNGVSMAMFAGGLKAEGLSSVNIHLDSLNESTYRRITGSGVLDGAIGGIGAAIDAGLEVKLNTVLMRGINDGEAEALIKFASGMGVPIRFIEMMPVGAAADFCRSHFMPVRELRAMLCGRHILKPIQGEPVCGPAEYFVIADSNAVVGFIGHSSNTFCRSCNRLRLLSDGTLLNCIAASKGLSLSNILSRMDDGELKEMICEYVAAKSPGHGGFVRAKSGGCFDMHAIGG